VSFSSNRRVLLVNADLAAPGATLVVEVVWANGSTVDALSAARFHTQAKVNATRIEAASCKAARTSKSQAQCWQDGAARAL
jgi:hypothetical protein